MKASTRALVGLIVLDLLLISGIVWMVFQVRIGALHAPDPGEAINRITTIGGGVVGIVTAILGFAFILHKRRGN